jgi:hypothetical protein
MALKEYRYQQATYLFEDGEAPDGAELVESAADEAPAPKKARTPSNKARTAQNKSTDGDAGDAPTE